MLLAGVLEAVSVWWVEDNRSAPEITGVLEASAMLSQLETDWWSEEAWTRVTGFTPAAASSRSLVDAQISA